MQYIWKGELNDEFNLMNGAAEYFDKQSMKLEAHCLMAGDAGLKVG